MKQYLDLLRHVKDNGVCKRTRTGVDAHSVFGYQMRFDLSRGFPAVTTKRLHLKSIVHELLWFLKGETNTRYLQENGVSIWDEWADEDGDLGPVYGKQWRAWECADGRIVDQIQSVVNEIRRKSNSRRMIVSAWNVADIDKMALPPCHVLFQFNVANEALSCHVYQRSADVFLGLPFNIASYALLTHLMAEVLGLKSGELIFSLGDAHLYDNHFQQALVQLDRHPMPLPIVKIKRRRDISDFSYEDIEIVDYESHPAIEAPVAV